MSSIIPGFNRPYTYVHVCVKGQNLNFYLETRHIILACGWLISPSIKDLGNHRREIFLALKYFFCNYSRYFEVVPLLTEHPLIDACRDTEKASEDPLGSLTNDLLATVRFAL